MKKALVADDHEIVLRFMTNLLSERGYQVLTAKDGLSALDILRTETPDIMFVDLIMPSISGEKLCQVISKIPRLKDLFIVILSGVAAEQQVNMTELGANACIAKGPLDKMKELVVAVLDKWEQEGPPNFEPEHCIGLENIHLRHPTKELLAIKKHFEVILGGMLEGIIETGQGGRIVYANRSAISLVAIAEKDLLGMDFIELFCEEDRRLVQELLDTVKQGRTWTAPDNALLTLNNRQVILNALPVGPDGSDAAVIVLNDVTETRRLEARVRQVHKIKAIGTLAGGIAHAFNNLLMGIQGNVSVMLMDSTHSHHERLKKIEKQIHSGAGLTSRLLAYARMGKYENRPFDLNALVREACITFGRTRKGIKLQQDLAEDLYGLKGDPSQIEQVIMSLLVNAEEAMPDGGDLVLKTINAIDNDMTAEFYDPNPGNYVLLSVTDTGIGMDKETKELIFDPFFTTKEMGRDTGLSLASVYGIIKGHNGYIEVESTKGKGTTVSIYLPVPEEKAPEKTGAAVLPMKKASGTVLLVDDEKLVLEAGAELLEAMGYRVLTARDGDEAIRVYKNNVNDIDIVLFDMVMPKVGGGRLYDLLKEINPNVKALLSSGFSVDGEATEILKRGCNGFIQKPFTMKDLSKELNTILDN